MATHSTIPAWEIPRTEDPGGLQSMGSQRVGHDLVTEKQQQGIQCVDLIYLYITKRLLHEQQLTPSSYYIIIISYFV